MLLMIITLFALYSIFDMSLRLFAFGNSKVEAVENARVALAKIERETRMSYPQDKNAGNKAIFDTTTASGSFFNSNSDRISFGNDLNGNGKVDGTDETIVYYVNDQKLMRWNNSSASLADLGPSGALEFKYFRDNGTVEVDTLNSSTEPSVDTVQIKLEVDVDGRTQELTTRVSIRNREGS